MSIQADKHLRTLKILAHVQVVGAIVHSAVHRDATGPVHVVQTENVVLYSYWNAKKQRQELAVMEVCVCVCVVVVVVVYTYGVYLCM